jgi:ATP-binding cassette subfamily E protein 1
VPQLSGGELQRLAIAATAVAEADVYLFDEASSFLDIKQRMTATEVIRSLTHSQEAEERGDRHAAKYVVAVE